MTETKFTCRWDEILGAAQWLEGDARDVHWKIFYGELGRSWWYKNDPESDQYRGHRHLAVFFESLLSETERTEHQYQNELFNQIVSKFESIRPAMIKAIQAMRAGEPTAS